MAQFLSLPAETEENHKNSYAKPTVTRRKMPTGNCPK
jgi:hypothetical protein